MTTDDRSETGETGGNADAITELKEAIEARIEARFGSGAPIYHLAQLGNDLGREMLSRVEEVTGRRLSDFVGQHTRFDLVPTPKDPKVLYLRSPDAPDDLTPSSAQAQERKRYKLGFWTAFHKPATPEERRFIDLDTGSFRAITDDSLAAPTGHVEIDEDLLSEEDWPDDADTTRRLEAWLERHDIEEARFLQDPTVRRAPGPKGSSTLLDDMLDALSPEQQRRVQLPLDVIATLRRG